MILINVTGAVKYLPMSRSTSKNKSRYDIMFDLAVAKKSTVDNQEIEFAIYLAHVIKQRVEHCVKTQTIDGKPMSAVYKKLSDRYNNSKPPRTKNKFWVNSGELIKRMRIWKSKSGINIGFPKGKKHPNSKANLVDILDWMENGNNKMVARSLFKPIISHISKNIDGYFIHWIKLQKA